jgi:hypothetical protein
MAYHPMEPGWNRNSTPAINVMSDPVRFAYRKQKAQAKQRGIEWRLEYWEWLQIWQDSGHLDERGKLSGQWVMARNGDVGPYSANNVKIVHCETNNGDAAKRRWVWHSLVTGTWSVGISGRTEPA